MNYQKQWGFLKKQFEVGQLAHAYLFSGQDLESIESFTKDFVKLVNCQSYKPHGREVCKTISSGEGICQNCKMIEKNAFPDLLVIESKNSESSLKNEKDMIEIDIKQIRNAQNFLSYKSYYGSYKSIIIENAERINQEAQSCFLKTLEEPKGKTLILLLTSKPDFLLPTIFSRCQQIKFFYKGKYEVSQDEEIILNDLEKVMHADLAEKFNYAKRINLDNGSVNAILSVLQKYFRQLLLAKVGLGTFGRQNYPVQKLQSNLRLIENLIYQVDTTNVNQKLALEILLMEI